MVSAKMPENTLSSKYYVSKIFDGHCNVLVIRSKAAQLTFDYKVDGIKWDHSGFSSSGNPIREIWTRQNQ